MNNEGKMQCPNCGEWLQLVDNQSGKAEFVPSLPNGSLGECYACHAAVRVQDGKLIPATIEEALLIVMSPSYQARLEAKRKAKLN